MYIYNFLLEEITFVVHIIVVLMLYQQITGDKVRFYLYFLLPIIFRVLFYIVPPIGYFSSLLFWLIYSLYKNKFSNRTLAVFFGLYPVVVESLFSRVIAFDLLPMFGVSINITNKFPVLSLLIELLIFPTFYYLTKTIQIDFKNLQIGFSKNQLKYYLLTFDISMAFYFILLQIFSIFTDVIPNALKLRENLVGIYVIYFLIMLIFLHSKITDEIDRELKEQKDNQVQNLEKYSSHIESLYEEIRLFRHDYINIITSIKSGIELNDIASIQNVYDTVLSKTVKDFSDRKYDIANLSKIENTALKSVLSAKLLEAYNKGVEIAIEVDGRQDLYSFELLDFITIISILLDNAIEATLLSKDPEINIAIFSHNDRFYFIVENKTREESVNRNNIFKNGFSTKGEERGIGLYKVTQILDKYPSASIRTQSFSYVFRQTIEIQKELQI